MLTREQFVALLARLRGEGEQLSADELRSLIAALPEHADDAELAEVETLCQALGDDDEVPLETVRAAVELVEAVRTEADARITAAEEEATERETLRRQLAGEEASDTGDGEGGEGAGDGTGEGEGEGEGADGTGDGGEGEGAGEGGDGGDGTGEGADAGTGGEQEPVGATAGGTQQRPAPRTNRRPRGDLRPAPAARERNRIVRDGGPNNEWGSLDEMSEAMVDRRLAMLSAPAGVTEKLTLGSIVAEYPEERRLDPADVALNQRRMSAVTAAVQNRDGQEFDAATAAGGPCAPFTPYYGYQQLAVGDRPFRASLEAFASGNPRAGIIFRQSPDFPTFADAVEFWTIANDEDPGSDGPATKPCLVVPCNDTEEAFIYAITECLTFGNFLAKFDPETVRNATENTMAAFARKADTKLIDLVKAASIAVPANDAPALGAFRDFVYHASLAAVGIRSRKRMRPDAIIEVRIPAWLYDMARLDLMRSLPGDGTLIAADNLLQRALAAASLRIAGTYIDSPTTGTSQVFATQGAGTPLLDFPDEVQWQIGVPGSLFLLDNGRLDLGVVRDSTLNATNDYQTFAESFEGLAATGQDGTSYWMTSKLCASGATSGTVDPSDFCSGQYVPTPA